MGMTDDYQSENCNIEFLSELMPKEAEEMIGKTIYRINTTEYSIEIIFTDGSSFLATGSRWGGCCMGADYKQAPQPKVEVV